MWVIAIAFIIIVFTILLPWMTKGWSWSTQNPSEEFEVNQARKVANHYTVINNNPSHNPINKNRILFNRYYHGIPETMTPDGRKLKGVPPNPKLAIHYLESIIGSSQGTERDIIQLAKIYQQGMHDLPPNYDLSLSILVGLLGRSQNPRILNEVRELISLVEREKALKWLNLPLDHDPQIIKDIEPTQDIVDPKLRRVRDTANIILTPLAPPPPPPMEEGDPDLYGTQFYNDSQNTHDPQVLGTVRHSIKQLQKAIGPLPQSSDKAIEEVVSYIQTLPSNDRTKDALYAIRKIKDDNTLLHGLNLRNKDVLNLVWTRIKDQSLSKENLISNLANMVEHGIIVCTIGIMDRIIDTLNVIDPLVQIKPEYAINTEMMDKAINIRRKILDGIPESHLFDSGQHPQQIQIERDIKNEILLGLTKDYVDSGIMTKEKFTEKIESWIEHI